MLKADLLATPPKGSPGPHGLWVQTQMPKKADGFHLQGSRKTVGVMVVQDIGIPLGPGCPCGRLFPLSVPILAKLFSSQD